MNKEALRSNINAMAHMFARAGDQEKSRACAEFAVSCGLWSGPQQRPTHLVENLRASALHEPTQFETVKYLQAHASDIRSELDTLQAEVVAKMDPAGQYLVKAGKWDALIFRHFDSEGEDAARLMPRTSEIVAALPDETDGAGVVSINWLYPNSHIVSHCGASNARLRIQLGLQSDPKAVIRINDEFQTWEDGKCFVFDDSFEHEVWHFGNTPRVVLICDIHHPDVPPERRDEIRQHHRRRSAETAQLLLFKSGLHNVTKTPDGAFRFEASGDLEAELLRYLDEF